MLSSTAILGPKAFWNGVGWAQYGIHLLLECPGILLCRRSQQTVKEEEGGRLYRILPPNELVTELRR